MDASLFPEGERELGTGVVISPIVVNDNVVDMIVVGPGATEGAPVQLKIAPQTAYVTITNQATTGKPGSKTSLEYTNEKVDPDGTRSVTLTGSLALGSETDHGFLSRAGTQPFCRDRVNGGARRRASRHACRANGRHDFKALTSNYTPENMVAEHVSPALKEDVKITLKVSQNLHASSMPLSSGRTARA